MLRYGMKIGLKLPLIMVLIAVVALYLAEYIAIANARAVLMGTGQERLRAVAQSRAAEIEQKLRSARADLIAKANNPVVLDAARAFVAAWPGAVPPPAAGHTGDVLQTGQDPYRAAHRRYDAFFSGHVASHEYRNLYIVSPAGRVVYSALESDRYADRLDGADVSGLGAAFQAATSVGRRDEAASLVLGGGAAGEGAFSAFLAVPVRSRSASEPVGIVILELGDRIVERVALRTEGLGQTGSVDVMHFDQGISPSEAIVEQGWTEPAERAFALLRRGGFGTIRTPQGETYVAAVAAFSFGRAAFSVIARQRSDEILAPARLLREETLRDGVPALGLVCVLGILLARSISVPLESVGRAMGSIAERRYAVDIPGRRRADEIGTIARRLDLFRASLLKSDAFERENAFKSAAFEGASAALMILDPDLTIIYVNDRLIDLMVQHQIALGRSVWGFRPDALPGRNLSVLLPGAQRLGDAAQRTRAREELSLGHVHLTLDIAPVRSRDGQSLLGFVVEWTDETVPRLNRAVIAAVNASLPIGSFTSDGRLIEANAPFAAWAATAPTALSGIGWNTLFPANAHTANPPWEDILHVRRDTTRLPLIPKAARPLLCTVNRVKSDQGRLLRFVLSAGDSHWQEAEHGPRLGVTERSVVPS